MSNLRAQSPLHLELLSLLSSWHLGTISFLFEGLNISRDFVKDASHINGLIELHPFRNTVTGTGLAVSRH